jgi:hypothetical protein
VVGARPRSGREDGVQPREFEWSQIAERAPILAATMQRYLDQISLSLRPASVVSADGMLRRFAGYLTANHPEIEALVDVDRSHIEAFKRYLPTRAGKNGRPPLSPQTIRMTLGTGSASVSALRHLDDPGWRCIGRPATTVRCPVRPRRGRRQLSADREKVPTNNLWLSATMESAQIGRRSVGVRPS